MELPSVVPSRYRVVEAVVIVGIALAFFALLLGFLRVLFPAGPGLREVVTREGPLPAAGMAEPTARDPAHASGSPKSSQEVAAGEVAAVLVRTTNTVKHRAADEISWSGVRPGERFRDRDAVQTFDNSTARLRFTEGNVLDMSPNSLVVIQRVQPDPVRRETPSKLVMVDGELRGTVSTHDRTAAVEVALPGGVVRVRSATRDRAGAQFKISMTEDHASTVAVYRGVAELDANGRTLQVNEDFVSTVRSNGETTAPVRLPARPKPVEPARDRTYSYRDQPQQIRFAWTAPAPVDGYHLVIARDPDFDDVVSDARVRTPEFRHNNLKHGTYYWRVSGIADAREGAYSNPARLIVVRDRNPPALNVHFPSKTRGSDAYTLTGRTEPGARVSVGGHRIPVTAAGSFQHSLRLGPGSTVIVVEAVDQAGNVAYRSELVNANF
ncbi:MAG: hypothetical protein A2638_05840 [Nitrospirae bacterium RIFCSPHIGHO2_01_FULL_66_17]|nr:MAG: hypothetical protein A2638_05840 [Nitrospirae bacterium RIFCSPHIGHO2_01_FULL_66_17]